MAKKKRANEPKATEFIQKGIVYDCRDDFERFRSSQESCLRGTSFNTFEELANEWEDKVSKDFPGLRNNAIRRVGALADIPLETRKQLSLGEIYELAISRLSKQPDGGRGDKLWSKPQPPAKWECVFDVVWRTLKRRMDDGNLTGDMISSKAWRFKLSDVPEAKRDSVS